MGDTTIEPSAQSVSTETTPALPDYVTSPNAVFNDEGVEWRYGKAPDYSKTRKVWEEGKRTFESTSAFSLIPATKLRLPAISQHPLLIATWSLQAGEVRCRPGTCMFAESTSPMGLLALEGSTFRALVEGSRLPGDAMMHFISNRCSRQL